MKIIHLIFIISFFCYQAFTQNNKFTSKYTPAKKNEQNTFQSINPGLLKLVTGQSVNPLSIGYQPSAPISFKQANIRSKKYQHSIWIEGKNHLAQNSRDKNDQHWDYLQAVQKKIGFENVKEAYTLVEKNADDAGFQHYRMQQMYMGLKVFGGELLLHEFGGEITKLNGIVYHPKDIKDIKHIISEEKAYNIAYGQLGINKAENQILTLLNLTDQIEKVIYFEDDEAHVAWHLELYPNHLSHWQFFIDVKTGEILEQLNNICQLNHRHYDHSFSDLKFSPHHFNEDAYFSGPATGEGMDLLGNMQTVNSFEENGTFYLIDASRQMFKSIGTENEQPSGVLWTLDAKNEAPGEKGYSASTLISQSPDWEDPKAVSAHFNAGIAFEFFKTIFGRNSINGNGGNIVSFINVVDEDGENLDNAFWNGAAMFYGNGKDGFFSLPAALDVAGHEMSHGVIQNTAGLVYQDESGALNESFADIFGVLIDDDDWTIGEDVVKPNVFTSGALRSMSDPHNGGFSLQDNGWQPRTVDEQYTGKEDNGGVHINSGIHNWAFFKVASAIGRDQAGQIFYRSLSTYLTRSSQFVDARLAAVNSAKDLFGAGSAQEQAVINAFNEVGILEGAPTENQQDVEQNPGSELILFVSSLFDKIFIYTSGGDVITEELTEFLPISRPSVTDDGSIVVFVSEDQIMRYVIIDWTVPEIVEINTIEENPQSIWRNVVISKDGTLLAALTADQNNIIYVFDLNTGQQKAFELYNPTFSEGVSTGDVLRADALEFDHSRQLLMYDAESLIQNESGADITFWDIGFLQVKDNETGDLADGEIFKLVNGLPQNVSIGNPTFSKNSPYIIAFDYLEIVDGVLGPTEEYYVFGANIETGEYNNIFQGTRLGFPTYSPSDQYLMFDSQSDDLFGVTPTLYAVPLGENKISFAPNQDFIQYKQDAYWSNWFATGDRNFSTSAPEERLLNIEIELFPNPAQEELNLQFILEKPDEIKYSIYQVDGKLITQQRKWHAKGSQSVTLPIHQLNQGSYFLQVQLGEKFAAYPFIKQSP